jgi:hypothetical protein
MESPISRALGKSFAHKEEARSKRERSNGNRFFM